MVYLRYVSLVVLWGLIATVAGACDMPRGDADVQAEPAEGSSDGPGLFTGKKGGLVIESEPWTGSSPYGDTSE